MTVDDGLAALAAAHGVATEYEDAEHRRVEVDRDVVAAVLTQLGVDPDAPPEEQEPARGTVVLRQGASHAIDGPGVVRCEDGTRVDVRDAVGPGLPLGWHELETAGADEPIPLVVTPTALAPVPRTWGWMLQLYAARSRRSWGMGDLRDLRTVVSWCGDTGAGALLLNPLQAGALTPRVEPSPYSPSSRRFVNPVHLRIEDVPEHALVSDAVRAEIDALRPRDHDLIDHDEVWAAKRAALELLWRATDPAGAAVVADWPDPATTEPGLRDFATFCALADVHGGPWREWPAELRHPDGPAVARARAEHADRVAFHVWLQRLCDQQLGAAHDAAAGMAIGVIHDLPVGVSRDGADAWALQDSLAGDVRVGAPPDPINQQGQDWALPPWRPDRLAASGYVPYRDMLRALLRHGDGIRVDHVAGLWRLWWIPPGEPASRGTYVRYDAGAMLGILALEAHRAGAVVVGEDLGTVEPAVTTALHDHEMLSSGVLWFEREDDADGGADSDSDGAADESAPGSDGAVDAGDAGGEDAGGAVPPLLDPARWPEKALASVSTHDLPTAAGFLSGEHVRTRAELGLLDDPEAEHERAAGERAELLDHLVAHGVLADADRDDERAAITAMHALLARTPSRVVMASPYDVMGERRQPNVPGTIDEYPNWRIPFSVPLEDLLGDERVLDMVAPLRAERGAGPAGPPGADGSDGHGAAVAG